jgi:hypothetical protein
MKFQSKGIFAILVNCCLIYKTVNGFVTSSSLFYPSSKMVIPSQPKPQQLQKHHHHRFSSQLYLDLAKNKNQNDWMPPPPEDQLTMSGDVFSLFLYSFLDHSMNDMYQDAILKAGLDGSSSRALMDPLDEFGISNHILPVWFDHVHTLLPEQKLMALISLPNVNYAPLLQTAGVASIALTATWLLCGYFSGAFLLRNTLECHITRMLIVTGQTWLLTTLVMCALAYGSDAFPGNSVSSVGGLTKADVDYIFDSLTVLITWRFMVSAIFGGFTKP